jgi:hypothetical protein
MRDQDKQEELTEDQKLEAQERHWSPNETSNDEMGV